MEGKKLAAALFLPFAFAALPLAILLFARVHQEARIAIRGEAVISQPPPTRAADPLTFHVADPSHDDCATASIPPIEG